MNGTCKIIGGNALAGSVTPIPNKNSLMGALPLAILFDEGFGIEDLPDTSDVSGFREIFDSMHIESACRGSVTFFDSSKIGTHRVTSERAQTFRG